MEAWKSAHGVAQGVVGIMSDDEPVDRLVRPGDLGAGVAHVACPLADHFVGGAAGTAARSYVSDWVQFVSSHARSDVPSLRMAGRLARWTVGDPPPCVSLPLPAD